MKPGSGWLTATLLCLMVVPGVVYIEQAIDAMAVEVERVAESQRYAARLLDR